MFRKQQETEKTEKETKEESPAAGTKKEGKETADEAGHSPRIRELEKQLEKTARELEQKKEEADKNLEMAKRLKAEFENYKKRMVRDYEENIRLANEELITKLFPVLQLLENALKTCDTRDEKIRSFHDGLELIWKELKKVLEHSGMTEIAPAKGEKFDPSACEAVMVEESGEHHEDVILELLEKGCRISNKLVRPARVKVGKPAAKTPDAKDQCPEKHSH